MTAKTVATNPPNSDTATMSSDPGLRSPDADAATSEDRATSTNTGTAKTKVSRKSERAARCGTATGSTTPKCNLDAMRLDRMPPNAPASSKKGGINTSRAGKTRNDPSRFSMVIPATTSMVPATRRTGSDSRTMRASSGSPARKAPISDSVARTVRMTPRIGVTSVTRTSTVAANNDGSVTTSPAAVTRGAATLSMSHPKRTEPAATPRVSARTTIDETTPPTTEMTTKSAMEMVCDKPNPTATAFANTASARDTENVNDNDASTF